MVSLHAKSGAYLLGSDHGFPLKPGSWSWSWAWAWAWAGAGIQHHPWQSAGEVSITTEPAWAPLIHHRRAPTLALGDQAIADQHPVQQRAGIGWRAGDSVLA